MKTEGVRGVASDWCSIFMPIAATKPGTVSVVAQLFFIVTEKISVSLCLPLRHIPILPRSATGTPCRSYVIATLNRPSHRPNSHRQRGAARFEKSPGLRQAGLARRSRNCNAQGDANRCQDAGVRSSSVS
jgi:hypothetical protein